MKRTPLVEQHRRAGGKLVDFAGWEMPIQYGGVLEEYQAVRTSVGLFDVSHMGRVTVAGRDSLTFLQQVTTNNVAKLVTGDAHYSMVQPRRRDQGRHLRVPAGRRPVPPVRQCVEPRQDRLLAVPEGAAGGRETRRRERRAGPDRVAGTSLAGSLARGHGPCGRHA